MNYKRKYKEALERAKRLHSEPTGGTERIICEQIFPELVSDEERDERIRKELLEHCKKLAEMYNTLLTAEEYNKKQSWIAWLEKQGEKSQGKSITKVWKDMRLEVFAQASGNRHEPNYSYNNTKIFSLNDIDEIIEKISEQNLANSAKICKDDK